MSNNKSEKSVVSKFKEITSSFKGVTSWHGSQDDHLVIRDDYPFYSTTNRESAKDFARGYCFGYDLQDCDHPTLYKVGLKFSNPMVIKSEEEWEEYGDIAEFSIDKMGDHDAIVFETENDTIYVTWKRSQVTLIRSFDVSVNESFKNNFTKSELITEGVIGVDLKEERDLEYDEYMKAVESGNIERCRRMVRDAAARAMPSTVVKRNGVPMPVLHGTDKKFNAFNGDVFWFSSSKKISKAYGDMEMMCYLNLTNPLDLNALDKDFNDFSVTWWEKYFDAEKKRPIWLNGDGKQYEDRKEAQLKSPSLKRLSEATGLSIERLIEIGEEPYGNGHYYGLSFIYNITNKKSFADEMRKRGFDGISCTEIGKPVFGVFSSEQIKSADPVTYDDFGHVIPLSKRFNMASSDIRESDVEEKKPVTADEIYMDAAKNGDTETCSEMILKSAMTRMPHTKVVDRDGLPKIVYHGTNAFGFKKFDIGKVSTTNFGFHFGTKAAADTFTDTENGKLKDYAGVYSVYLDITNPFECDDIFGNGQEYFEEYALEELENVSGPNGAKAMRMAEEIRKHVDEYNDLNNRCANKEKLTDDELNKMNYRVFSTKRMQLVMNAFIWLGYDGVIYKNDGEDKGSTSYIAFWPEQIKSADPITYDDNGNIIPLSKRFSMMTADIRESIEHAEDEPAVVDDAEIAPEPKKCKLESPCWKNPEDWKKDEFLIEFKHKLGYRDDYFPTRSYGDASDWIAREYALEQPTDTAAEEIEADAVMLMIKSGLEEPMKVAKELGKILMGDRKEGRNHENRLKAMQKAFRALRDCAIRFDQPEATNESVKDQPNMSEWYRGVGNEYAGREHEFHEGMLWLAGDKSVAKMYAPDPKTTSLFEYVIDEKKLNSASRWKLEELFGCEFYSDDLIDGLGEDCRDELKKRGYNAFDFLFDDTTILVLLNSDPIVDRRQIVGKEYDEIECDD